MRPEPRITASRLGIRNATWLSPLTLASAITTAWWSLLQRTKAISLGSIGKSEAERLLVERSRCIGIGAVEIDVGEPLRPIARGRLGGVDDIAVDEPQKAALRTAHGHDGAAIGRVVRCRGRENMAALCRRHWPQSARSRRRGEHETSPRAVPAARSGVTPRHDDRFRWRADKPRRCGGRPLRAPRPRRRTARSDRYPACPDRRCAELRRETGSLSLILLPGLAAPLYCIKLQRQQKFINFVFSGKSV